MDIRNLCCNSVTQLHFFYLEHFYVHIFKKKKQGKNFVNKSKFGNKSFSFYIKSKYISPIS